MGEYFTFLTDLTDNKLDKLDEIAAELLQASECIQAFCYCNEGNVMSCEGCLFAADKSIQQAAGEILEMLEKQK